MTKEEIYQKNVEVHISSINKILQSMVKRPSDREDLLQEVRIRAWNYLDNWKNKNNTTWIWMVTKNIVKDYCRHNKKRWELCLNFTEIDDHAHDFFVIEDQNIQQLEAQDFLNSLKIPEKYANILYRHYVQGYSLKEIADHFNVSERAIRSLLHRALKSARNN